MQNSKSFNKSKNLKSPKLNSILECRGAFWRFLKEENGFWNLELIKQGANFSEAPINVWAIPNLEEFKIIEGEQAFCPKPTQEQVSYFKLLKPTLEVRKQSSISANTNSKAPMTAINSAIEHKKWQFEPWHRIVDQLPFPRLLIADDVGLGKTTETAIILAELTKRKRADRTLIVSPQHLCEKWQSELFNRFGLTFEIYNRATRERLAERGVLNPWEMVERVIVSRDFVKRWENLKPLSSVQWDMVVIDECHHFVKDETGTSTRLRDFAEKIVYKSPGLLLLSATPFTGSEKEFKSLLSLIDPKFSSTTKVKWDPNSPYLVRRLKQHVKDQGEDIKDRIVEDVQIQEKDLSKTEKQAFDEVSEVLLNRRNNKNSAGWDRLLEEVARKRLSSSWEAFYETISSDSKISEWFEYSTKKKIDKIITSFDSAKLKRLSKEIKNIFDKDKQAKIVIFTEAIKSQEAIANYLINKEGFKKEHIAAIDSSMNSCVEFLGKKDRTEIEEDFANPNSKLKILIATDTISEGKDLQHACHHLINFELPWSIVKIEQRAGRIDRLGQPHSPYILNMVLDIDATPDQRVMSRLRKKISEAQIALGSVSPILESLDIDIIEAAKSENSIKLVEKTVDESIAHLKQFGFDTSSITPLTPSPISTIDDSKERQILFDLMVTELGGSLSPLGQNTNEHELILPEGWTLPTLLTDAFGYPSQYNSWRVTFNSKHYLNYEKYTREGGESRKPLLFLGPVHPIVMQAESRFRHRMNRQNYPIFGVKNAPTNAIVVVEFTVRAPSGRIVSQEMKSFCVKTHKIIEGKNLDVISSAGQPKSIPNLREWDSLHKFLNQESAAISKELESHFIDKKKTYLKEHKTLDASILGMSQREEWINDLWSIDQEQSQYQICALLLNQ